MKDLPRPGWEEVTVGDVVTLHYGKALPREERNSNGPVPVYGANGIKDNADRSLTDGPSLVIGRKGSAGEITRVDGPFWPLDVTYHTSHDLTRLDFDYLHYALSLMNLPQLARGVKPGINRNDVYSLPLALPPLEEQRQIVAVLDEAFEGLARARANAEANLQSAGELLPSFLGQSFPSGGSPWPTPTVGELVEDGVIDRPLDGNHGETHPKKADFVPEGVPFIMASDLIDGEVDQQRCNFIKREQADALRKGFAIDGDVLLSHKGTIGRVALLDTKLNYVMLTPQVTYYRIKDNTRLDRHFLYYAFKSAPFQKQMMNVAEGGATRAYIGITRQLDLKLPLPPLTEQRLLVERFRSAETHTASLVAHYRAKLVSTDDLRQSLLQAAFSGELT